MMKRNYFKKFLFGLLSILFLIISGCETKQVVKVKVQKRKMYAPRDLNIANEPMPDHKLVIYQSMTRLFGNKKSRNKLWGTSKENGVGKFKDYTYRALKALKKLGVTHMYYTGVIAHAVVKDYSRYGIPVDDADVIKGRAGSPFAIKDYYDVNPDLAVNVRKRLREYKGLIKRTHRMGMKVIMDFVPNHVGRSYKSLKKPRGVKDLGQGDDTTKRFAPNNNFYYLPGQSFRVPSGYQNLATGTFKTKDGKFNETPAKATGNDQFTASPSVGTWFETIKLNYGVDIQRGRSKNFSPIPSTWKKMLAIVKYWARFGVDGMRCDMVEMVPVEFWAWAIPKVKKVSPKFIFIAEIYNPRVYQEYLEKGKFDYLYDKVGMYDAMRRLMSGNGNTGTMGFNWWNFRTMKNRKGYAHRMLRFLENHDEQRIASRFFANDAWTAIPAMTVSATMSSGPVMLYYGQEVGEPASGKMGFSGDDGRTTIFDYWGVPEHQKWMNGGRFDGGKLSVKQKKLRGFYKTLLANVCQKDAISKGKFYELHFANERNRSVGYDQYKMYSYLRYTKNQVYMIVVNFDKYKSKKIKLRVPARAWKLMGLDLNTSYQITDVLLSKTKAVFKAADVADWKNKTAGIPLAMKPMSAYVFELKKVKAVK